MRARGKEDEIQCLEKVGYNIGAIVQQEDEQADTQATHPVGATHKSDGDHVMPKHDEVVLVPSIHVAAAQRSVEPDAQLAQVEGS